MYYGGTIGLVWWRSSPLTLLDGPDSTRLAREDPKSGSAVRRESGGSRGDAGSPFSRVLDTLRAGVPNPQTSADRA